jgi:hypothetical protein
MPTCGRCKVKNLAFNTIKEHYTNGCVAANGQFKNDGQPDDTDRRGREVNDDNVNWPDEVKDGPLWPASPKQIKYVLGLQNDRILPDDYSVKDEEALQKMERDQASGIINLLKTFAMKDGKVQHDWTMPEGKYAIEEDDEQGWHFYQIDKPTEGRWKGYTFIKELIGAPGAWRKIDVPRGERTDVLQWIQKDPKRAMLDFGLQTVSCGACGSPLSNKASRERGMGPDCAAKGQFARWFG